MRWNRMKPFFPFFLLISYNLRQIRHIAIHCQIVAKDSGKALSVIAATQHHEINSTYFTNFFSYFAPFRLFMFYFPTLAGVLIAAI